MSSAFYDTNVLIYAARPQLEQKDEHKRAVACDLVGRWDFCISAQVLAEFFHNTVKKGKSRLTEEQADVWLTDLSSRPCAEIDTSLVMEGIAFSRRYQLSYWDGAIVAAANRLGSTQLYTEDLNDGQLYGDVKVINPFKSIPH
jgi:predicted nucleic acid-binding protein